MDRWTDGRDISLSRIRTVDNACTCLAKMGTCTGSCGTDMVPKDPLKLVTFRTCSF